MILPPNLTPARALELYDLHLITFEEWLAYKCRAGWGAHAGHNPDRCPYLEAYKAYHKETYET